MKKLIALILTIVYMTASSGVVLNLHYCMGNLASIRVDNFKDNLCKCGMKSTSKGCCHNEVKVVKLTNVHKQAIVNFLVSPPVDVMPSGLSLIDICKSFETDVNISFAKGPPILNSPPIYLSNCVFRI